MFVIIIVLKRKQIQCQQKYSIYCLIFTMMIMKLYRVIIRSLLLLNNQMNLFIDSLDNLQHSCTTCPLDLVLVDDTQLNSSLWSHVYICDICHCTRASEDNMIRHLETELHLSATEYQADSATMTLNHCIRRSCIQLCKHDTNMLDSIIVS